MNVFVRILHILRQVLQELVSVFATLAQMVFQILALMLKDRPTQASLRQEIWRDWMWLRAKTASFLPTVSDLFVDLMLNSG